MSGLLDKIRAMLGRRGPQPGDASQAYANLIFRTPDVLA
jgi:hypothetical protein